MECFQELYPDFPLGEYEPGESPDFILTTADKKTIGIELVSVLTDQEFQRHLSLQNKLADKVVEHLDKILPFKFALTLKIYPNNLLSTEIKRLSEVIALNYFQEFLGLASNRSATLRNLGASFTNYPIEVQEKIHAKGYHDLPKQIKSIELRRTAKMDYSFNTQATGLTMPDLQNEHLADIIESKNEKIKQYKNTDYKWLIICEGEGPASYFDEIKITTPIISGFDNVYLLRMMKREILVLK